MISLERANRLIDSGLSITTVGENKKGNFSWKKYQSEQITKEEFEKQYNSHTTKNVAIITGFNGVECIDVDTKVMNTLKEKKDFWSEYVKLLQDNIENFEEKFSIYKTVSGGFHLIYKCNTIQGNQSLAKLQGMKSSLIETRGVGGYIIVYEICLSKNDYTKLVTISEQDREILFAISRMYDYKGDMPIDEPKKSEFIADGIDISPWADYNEKHSCLDLIDGEFEIVGNLKNKYILKRYGATSAHSGYVYKENGCMYLFSTGTNYPAEKLISPFAMFTYKYFNGDFTKAASELYSNGYGSRKVQKPKVILSKEKVTEIESDITFPLDVFPEDLHTYITECHRTLGLSPDYMGCSLLWLTSVIVGNAFTCEIRTGWIENATMWISVVGKAGIGKTPSINQMLFPLMKVNNREIKKYIKQYARYVEYEKLDKKQKEYSEEIRKPMRTQFIVNDITLEALVDMHEENKNAVGVFKDELAGWFKDMNKYRQGSDLEFWLSSWSGKSVSLNRKTAKSSFVEKPLIPVLGGIQPSIFDQFNTEENKDNGFTDRMLISYPELFVDFYNNNQLSEELVEWYSAYIIKFYDMVKSKYVKYNLDDEIDPLKVVFSSPAQAEYERIFNKITKMQNSDEENEYMKSMLPKQKAYVARFALLLNCLWAFDNQQNVPFELIMEQSILKAEKLSDYFISMSKKVKIDSNKKKDLKKVVTAEKGKSKAEIFKKMFQENPELNRSQAAELLEVGRATIQRWIKELEA